MLSDNLGTFATVIHRFTAGKRLHNYANVLARNLDRLLLMISIMKLVLLIVIGMWAIGLTKGEAQTATVQFESAKAIDHFVQSDLQGGGEVEAITVHPEIKSAALNARAKSVSVLYCTESLPVKDKEALTVSMDFQKGTAKPGEALLTVGFTSSLQGILGGVSPQSALFVRVKIMSPGSAWFDLGTVEAKKADYKVSSPFGLVESSSNWYRLSLWVRRGSPETGRVLITAELRDLGIDGHSAGAKVAEYKTEVINATLLEKGQVFSGFRIDSAATVLAVANFTQALRE